MGQVLSRMAHIHRTVTGLQSVLHRVELSGCRYDNICIGNILLMTPTSIVSRGEQSSFGISALMCPCQVPPPSCCITQLWAELAQPWTIHHPAGLCPGHACCIFSEFFEFTTTKAPSRPVSSSIGPGSSLSNPHPNLFPLSTCRSTLICHLY